LLSIIENVVRIDVKCSRGTYIRTLANDVGNRLGCGGYLSALERVAEGEFKVEDSVTLEVIKDKQEEIFNTKSFHSIESLLPNIPKLILYEKEDAKRFVSGSSFNIDGKEIINPLKSTISLYTEIEDNCMKILYDRMFLGIGLREGESVVKPKTVFYARLDS
jgi:tRNA pseudouridine55 synthase